MLKKAECCCGKTIIELEGDFAINAVCHCDNCKKRTGSAFGHSVYFAKEQAVSIPETTNIYHVAAKTGDQQRYFCVYFGTTLYWEAGMFPNMFGVAGGCFIEDLPEPTISVSNENCLDWVEIPQSWDLF